ncbi:hypothetical protein [Aeromonas hydrophila]|uniref:hypothetical protein n=1 Tax=Aeromonas hydrophila TaxID=644 RepID=UPI00235FE13C|nr:hypothetical protein [Aeromonas hydrophila]
MFPFFASKSEAMVWAAGIIIGFFVLLAFVTFKVSFDKYKKYLIVREKFYSEDVQKVVEHVYPHHEQLKSESLRELFWGFAWSIIAVVIFFFVTNAGSQSGIHL